MPDIVTPDDGDIVISSLVKLADIVTLTDSVTKQVSITLDETLTLFDVRSRAVNLNETLLLTDSSIRSRAVFLSETTLLHDALKRSTAKKLNDTMIAIDTKIAGKICHKTLRDTVSLTHVSSKSIHALCIETILNIDTLIKHLYAKTRFDGQAFAIVEKSILRFDGEEFQ